MTAYRHFDLAHVERGIRSAAERGLMLAMERAKSDTERHGYELQRQMFEAQIAMQVQVFALVNQGESADAIAKTVGICIANLIGVALSVSDQPHWTGLVIDQIISNAIDSMLGAVLAGSVSVAEATIIPTRGGRA